MSGQLPHSPADVLRWVMIGQSIGCDPETKQSWPIYSPAEPNEPDNVITLRDTIGQLNGYLAPINRQEEYHGVQVRVRSTDPRSGYNKCRAIAVFIDELTRRTVTINSTTYLITGARTGDVLPLGKDAKSARNIHTLNVLLDVYINPS